MPRASTSASSPKVAAGAAASAQGKPAPLLAAAAPEGIFAGTSGWAYATWKPGFYPAGVSQKSFLSFYASQLTSVEVNYTFRALPTAKMLEGWLAATPEGFRFSFKAPQRITHFSRLRDCAAAVTQFASAVEPVRQAGKLGLLLFQLPPNFKADVERLHELLRIPALAGPQGMRVAFEFRHESWFTDEVYAALREHNAALCVAESDDLQTPEVHTAATHVCFRLRRNGGYTAEELGEFARRLVRLRGAEGQGAREVYAYFKHEDEPTGALNARVFLAEASKVAQGGEL